MRGCPGETFIPLPQEETSLNYHVCDPGSHSQVVPRSSRQGLGHRPSPGTSPQTPAEGLAPHFSSSVVYTGLQMGSNLPSIAQYPAETLGLAFFNLCWNLLLAEGTEPRCWLGPTGCSQTASSGAGYQGCSPRKELSLSAVVQRCLWPGQKFPSQQRGWAWHRALLLGVLAAGRDCWHLQPVPACAGAPGVSCSGRNPDYKIPSAQGMVKSPCSPASSRVQGLNRHLQREQAGQNQLTKTTQIPPRGTGAAASKGPGKLLGEQPGSCGGCQPSPTRGRGARNPQGLGLASSPLLSQEEQEPQELPPSNLPSSCTRTLPQSPGNGCRSRPQQSLDKPKARQGARGLPPPCS